MRATVKCWKTLCFPPETGHRKSAYFLLLLSESISQRDGVGKGNRGKTNGDKERKLSRFRDDLIIPST